MYEDYFDELRRIVATWDIPIYTPYDMDEVVLHGQGTTSINYNEPYRWNMRTSAHLTAAPTARYYRNVKAAYITPLGINRVYYGGLIPEIVRLDRCREGVEELTLYNNERSFKEIVSYFEQEDIMERARHYIR